MAGRGNGGASHAGCLRHRQIPLTRHSLLQAPSKKPAAAGWIPGGARIVPEAKPTGARPGGGLWVGVMQLVCGSRGRDLYNFYGARF
jgi:hypothetical protein